MTTAQASVGGLGRGRRERCLLPVASPSASDLQVSAALAVSLGVELVRIADGLSTLELTLPELQEQELAAEP